MGYSCSTLAMDVLKALISRLQVGNEHLPQNTWVIKDRTYFYEIGRVQPDRAITGTVWEITVGDRLRRAGNFRISRQGTIERFPTTTKDVRTAAESGGRESFDKRRALVGLAF